MALHLIQRRAGYAAGLAAAGAEDPLLLLGEGVLAVLDGAQNCLASAADLSLYGLGDRLDDRIQAITDEQIVTLCTQHQPIVTWTAS